MGPAYAAAALFVRFDPSANRAEHPLDIKRAHVVLGTLDWLNDQKNDAFSFELKRLTREWEDLQARVPAPATMSAAEQTLLNDLVVAVCEQFGEEFYNEGAQYGFHSLWSGGVESGWNFVMKWCQDWQKSLEDRAA